MAEFGLENAVLAAGSDFVEVVAPVRADAPVARHLARQGADVAGYMVLVQLADDDHAAARRRAAALGVREVYAADLGDVAGVHLHPHDVPGAIVSLDRATPAASWRWAGPDWTGRAPAGARAGGLAGLVVAVADPEAAAARWAAVLGVAAAGTEVELDGGRQRVRFVAGDAGITVVEVVLPGAAPARLELDALRLDITGEEGEAT